LATALRLQAFCAAAREGKMNSSKAKQKIAHELREFLFVFLFIAPLFLSFEGYRIYLLHEPGSSLFKYGVALLNALVLSKVILLGEMAGLARYSEHKPLIISTILKAGMFTVLYVFFHVLEHTIQGLVHRETLLHSVAIACKDVIPPRVLTVFFAFVPFFALFETRRVMGEDEFFCLFMGRQPRSGSARDSHNDTRRPTTLKS
jgi:hypothetical protein